MIAAWAWAWPGAAWAWSWCAEPLVVHEWGVHVVRVDGGKPASVPLPSWFHHTLDPIAQASSEPASSEPASSEPASPEPVRDLPADDGIRLLPVVQFYLAPEDGPRAPVALEVGFRDGEASSWWPAVDRRVAQAAAGSVEAMRGREQLLAARAALLARNAPAGTLPLGPDPTKQLGWDRLELSDAPSKPLNRPERGWVTALREVPGAAWVSRAGESDRFVYYEATTKSASDITVERIGGTAEQPRVRVTNRSDFDVHDLVILAGGRAATAPSVPHGAWAELTLDQPLDRDALLTWLRGRWTDPTGGPVSPRMNERCTMMRIPAVPVEEPLGHRLYEPELDVFLDLWADRMLEGAALRAVYREDTAALDARMPLSVYTDMYHYVELNRLGIVVVEGVQL